jgi:tetratricopeptide (TPR) repeat protein
LISLFYSGNAVTALDATKQLLLQTSNSDSNLSMMREELLGFKGRIEAFRGDFDDSILSLKEAKRGYEEKGWLEAPTLVIINLYLLLVYSRKHDYRTALGIAEDFQDILDRYHKHTMWWFLWNAHKAHIYVDLGEFEIATMILDQVEVPEDKNWKRLEAFVASVKAKLYLYENHRNIESAQDQYDILEESIKEVQVHGLSMESQLALAGVANM